MKRKQIGPTLSAQLQEFRQQMLSTPILQTVSANSVDLTDTVCRIFPIDGLNKIRNAVSEIFSPSKIYDIVIATSY